MSIAHTHTIPIPLPDNLEASATLTRFLQAMEATGLCRVKAAVIVETENWNAYQVIDDLINPPKPEANLNPVVMQVPSPDGKNGHSDPANEYRIVATGQTITVGKLRQDLRFKRLEVGTQLLKTTKFGEALMEVFASEDGKYALRKVKEKLAVAA